MAKLFWVTCPACTGKFCAHSEELRHNKKFQLLCPYCGKRAEIEFSYGAEAHVERPQDPAALSDAEWAQYLFMNDNTKGVMRERWVHSHGCGRWFNLARDTLTDEILVVYKVGETAPTLKPKTYV